MSDKDAKIDALHQVIDKLIEDRGLLINHMEEVNKFVYGLSSSDATVAKIEKLLQRRNENELGEVMTRKDANMDALVQIMKKLVEDGGEFITQSGNDMEKVNELLNTFKGKSDKRAKGRK